MNATQTHNQAGQFRRALDTRNGRDIPAAESKGIALANQQDRERTARRAMEVVQIKARYTVTQAAGQMTFTGAGWGNRAIVTGRYEGVGRYQALKLTAVVGEGAQMEAWSFAEAARQIVEARKEAAAAKASRKKGAH